MVALVLVIPLKSDNQETDNIEGLANYRIPILAHHNLGAD
jgi:hypothetical protein